MGPLSLSSLREHALLLVDSPPIIYVIEDHQRLAAVFAPVFAAHAEGQVRLAVTTMTIAEVLSGPLRTGDEALAERYRAILNSWYVVDLDADIAERAARLRTAYRLKLGDAVQAASAIAINADALVTHDRDFSAIIGLRVIGTD